MQKQVVRMTEQKEILTAKEVAAYFNIHPLTVHKYAREGKIPAFKIGTDWRFHKKYLERWIREKSMGTLRGKGGKCKALEAD